MQSTTTSSQNKVDEVNVVLLEEYEELKNEILSDAAEYEKMAQPSSNG